MSIVSWPPILFCTVGLIVLTATGRFDASLLLGWSFWLFLGFLSLATFRHMALMRRIGPGTLTVTRAGIRDTRLSDEMIPWTSFNGVRFRKRRGSSRSHNKRKAKLYTTGVMLTVNPEAALPWLNPDYGAAFQPETSLRAAILIDLSYFRRRQGLARFIVRVARGVQPMVEGAEPTVVEIEPLGHRS